MFRSRTYRPLTQGNEKNGQMTEKAEFDGALEKRQNPPRSGEVDQEDEACRNKANQCKGRKCKSGRARFRRTRSRSTKEFSGTEGVDQREWRGDEGERRTEKEPLEARHVDWLGRSRRGLLPV